MCFGQDVANIVQANENRPKTSNSLNLLVNLMATRCVYSLSKIPSRSCFSYIYSHIYCASPYGRVSFYTRLFCLRFVRISLHAEDELCLCTLVCFGFILSIEFITNASPELPNPSPFFTGYLKLIVKCGC